MAGTLYLCATPIGNLDDMTLRVLKLLETADIIAAEDTRNTLKLLNHFEIKTPMTSYHEHNKAEKGPKLVERLLAGENIALVTDAGMPGISDPGADLVKLCYEAGVPVTVAPGASAAVVALVLSGLDTRRFVFEGFLPMEKKERRAVLSTLEKEHRTMIFYEAPHRLLDTLEELEKIFGSDREMAAIRELTKKFEEVRRGTLAEIKAHFTAQPPKGEFVLVFAGYTLQQQRQAWENKRADVSTKTMLWDAFFAPQRFRRFQENIGMDIAFRDFYFLLYEGMKKYEEVQSYFAQNTEERKRVLRRILERGKERKEIAADVDIESCVMMTLAMQDGILALKVLDETIDDEEKYRYMEEQLWRDIAAQDIYLKYLHGGVNSAVS